MIGVRGNGPDRRILIPETVQSSAMDCGPAVLRSLLAGFGIEFGYGRLREACQTGVDGTSIGAIDELANAFGLRAEEVMLPADDLLLPAARALPAVVVVLAGGVTHYVVLWRRHGSRLQVMDPATGRRWPDARRFFEDVFIHRHPVAATDWREWAEGEEATAVLHSRLTRLGAAPVEASRLLEGALASPGWRGPAALAAAARLGDRLTAARALRRGSEAVRLTERLAAEAAASERPRDIVPERFWPVWPGDDPVDSSTLELRGAVLVRVRGRRPEGSEVEDSSGAFSRPPELAAAGAREPAAREPAAPPPGVMRRLFGFLRRGGGHTLAALASAAVAAALMLAFEALLLNGLLRTGGQLAGTGQLPAALAALLVFVGALALLELATAIGVRDLGRHLEARLRFAFLEKIPRLGDRWFRSRLPSDLAERAHSAVLLRTLPDAVRSVGSGGCELIFTAVALGWFYAGTAPLAVLAALTAVAVPLALQPYLAERELRMRHHGAALARLQLDALLGLLAVRSHGAEPLVRRQHDEILNRWRAAGADQLRGSVVAMVVQALAGYGLAAALVALHIAREGIGGGTLLLAYWALKLPELGAEIAAGLERIPHHRGVATRLLEPLGAPEDEVGPRPAAGGEELAPTGVAVSLRRVTVTGGGGPILDQVDVEIPAGGRVAILGRSGAGKSTLLALLLGLERPAAGEVRIDGEVLDAAAWARLRGSTAWVDPAVRLWNRSLLDNLRYGNGRQPSALGEVLSAAELAGVLEGLPEGLATALGEGGGLVSGGEGQRVRFGRALGRGAARLVLLDEPFRGLDRGQRDRLLATARDWWPRATFLVATHDDTAVRDFDQVVLLDAGGIAESGSPAALAADEDSLYAGLLATENAAWSERDWRSLRLVAGRPADGEGEEAG
ncbi:MAG: ATP-binding cassette domain-containing protein [Acidobacteriota bacterium]